MAVNPYNDHNFYLHTKTLEQEALSAAEAAAVRVKELATRKGQEIRVRLVAVKICEDAYRDFKNSIGLQFPSEAYRRLVQLTIDSRLKLFHLTLKERLISILEPLEG